MRKKERMLFFLRPRLLFKNKSGTKLVLLTGNSSQRGMTDFKYSPLLSWPWLAFSSDPFSSFPF